MLESPATDPGRAADQKEMREFRKALALACNDPGHFVGFKGERSLGEWQVDALLSGPLAPILQEAAQLRARLHEAEKGAEAVRSEMPETLDTGNLIHDVRTLRMAHDSMHRHAYRWGKAALLLLPFVDMAAGEGLEWAEQADGSPRMDAADLCAAFAKAMGCELGDAGYMVMLAEGRGAIRALAPAPEANQEAGDGR